MSVYSYSFDLIVIFNCFGVTFDDVFNYYCEFAFIFVQI